MLKNAHHTRVLARRTARELTAEEISHVFGRCANALWGTETSTLSGPQKQADMCDADD